MLQNMLRNSYWNLYFTVYLSCWLVFFPSEHSEPDQPKLLLGAGAECELPGPLHEDGDRHAAAEQRHHHPAAQRESGKIRSAHSECLQLMKFI